MILRIQSFTDVITNSSSSVFVMQSDIADKYRNIEEADDCIGITPITINWLQRNLWEAEMVCDLLHIDPKTLMNYRESKYGGYYDYPSQEVWDQFLKDHRKQIKETFKDLYWVDIEDHFEGAYEITDDAYGEAIWSDNRH